MLNLKCNIPQQQHGPAKSSHILVAHGVETLEGVSHLSVCTLLGDERVSVIYRLPVGRTITLSLTYYDFYCTLNTVIPPFKAVFEESEI
jgi:hypothetical protein